MDTSLNESLHLAPQITEKAKPNQGKLIPVGHL
jgi:hypothetical protein